MWAMIWVGWFLYFCVAEGIAINDDIPGNTLSEHLRKWFHVKEKPGRAVFVVVTGILAAWFIPHILGVNFG